MSVNREIAARFDEMAQLLAEQDASAYRVEAYRRGADTLRDLARPVSDILREEGLKGLEHLPAIGAILARAIRALVERGRLPMLDRLRRGTNRVTLLASVPGVGTGLAGHLYHDLDIDSLEALETAAYDGRLEQTPWIGEKRLAAIRDSLARRLARVRSPVSPSSAASPASGQPDGEPAVADLLAVDRQYRRRAADGSLRTIAPRRFNPGHQAWLPILHTRRAGRDYTVLFSNTQRAHELGRTRDWVVLYAGTDGGERQYTVVSARQGALRGRRVVRGRERECLEYYRERTQRRRHAAMRAVVVCGLTLMAAVGSSVAQRAPGVASRADSLVAAFYAGRGAHLAWATRDGSISPHAWDLVRALAQAGEHGLDAGRYGLDSLYWALEIPAFPALAVVPPARLDAQLTRAFLSYAADVAFGQAIPSLVDARWTADPPTLDLVAVLDTAITSGRVAAVLRELPPDDGEYVALRRALAQYREVARRGGWPVLAPNVEEQALGRRLAAEGYRSVHQFQAAHGLEVDGVVGPRTLAALNVSAADRAEQIALNLERRRWLPRALGERRIVVNSAAFTLTVIDSGAAVLAMRVVAGRPDWPTPITSSVATELVFRPSWSVPRSIAVEEILPLLRRDPRYLKRHGIRIFPDSASNGAAIDGAAIDWTAVTESTFRYRLVQEPGPRNPLGRLALVFPSAFAVRIHDTPARALLGARERAFSHGCVRVADALGLAAYVLPDWSRDSIRAAMDGNGTRRVRLPPIAVHLVYWTAWVGRDGVVEFRDDVYGWDQKLRGALGVTALATAVPAPAPAPAPADWAGCASQP